MTATTLSRKKPDVPRVKENRCVRCGVDMYKPNAGCKDCISVDPVLMRRWRKAR